jgi:hypothetical protein
VLRAAAAVALAAALAVAAVAAAAARASAAAMKRCACAASSASSASFSAAYEQLYMQYATASRVLSVVHSLQLAALVLIADVYILCLYS